MTAGGGFKGVDRWLRAHGWLPDAALAILLAIILLPASLPLVLDSTAAAFTKMALTVAIVVAQIAVALRRSHPAAAYLVCCAAMAVLVAAPPLTGLQAAGFAEPLPAILLPSSGVYLVLLYSVAAEGVGRMPAVALLLGGVGVVLTGARLLSAQIIATVALRGWPLPAIVVGALAAVVVAAWSLGRFQRVRKDYVRSLADRARQAEADRSLRAQQAADRERARIAREMHDVVSHSLAVMVAQAEAGRMAGAKDPALGIAVLPTIAATGREAMADMRSLLGVLRDDQEPLSYPTESSNNAVRSGAIDAPENAPGTLGRSPPAPQPRIADIPNLVDRIKATGLPVRLEETGEQARLDATAELAAYRVVQEALTNVVKHAHGTTGVAVSLLWSLDELTIVVDDGEQAGAAPTDPTPNGTGPSNGGQGLNGMRDRVTAVGGVLSAGSTANGFRIIAKIPVSSRADAVTEPELT